jgi:MFS family permease
MMATLVVGPFYLSRGLGLEAVFVGLVLSLGPLVTALTGVPAGRIADRFGAPRMTIVGPIGIAAGCILLSMMPSALGIPGYVAPIAITTIGYALFQTANNAAVMADVLPHQRGRHVRHAQSVAKFRPHHRRIGDGRCVRARIGDDRHHKRRH